MKKYILIAVGLCILGALPAERAAAQIMLQKAVISNAGGAADNTTTRFVYTVGEAAAGMASNGTTVGNFGFWGANGQVSAVRDDIGSGTIRALGFTPNPASATVAINVKLSAPGTLDVLLYDASGRLVSTIFSGRKDAGEFNIYYDVRPLAQGEYVVAARMPGALMQSQLIVVR